MTDYDKIELKLMDIMSYRGVSIDITPIYSRTDGGFDDGYDHKRNHYRFNVYNNKYSYTGEYSKGCSDTIKAVKKTPKFLCWNSDKELTLSVLNGRKKLVDIRDNSWADFMFKISKRKSVIPNPVDIFSSLLFDSQGSDENFEYWAESLGYDSNSMKAYKMWETCNKTRRTLQNILGSDFEKSCELANQL